jgi:hypothetical protein
LYLHQINTLVGERYFSVACSRFQRKNLFTYQINNGNIADAEFEKLMKKYCDDSFNVRIKRKIKKVLKEAKSKDYEYLYFTLKMSLDKENI